MSGPVSPNKGNHLNRSPNKGEQFALSTAPSMTCFPTIEMDQQVAGKMLRGTVRDEVETCSAGNCSYGSPSLTLKLFAEKLGQAFGQVGDVPLGDDIGRQSTLPSGLCCGWSYGSNSDLLKTLPQVKSHLLGAF